MSLKALLHLSHLVMPRGYPRAKQSNKMRPTPTFGAKPRAGLTNLRRVATGYE
jgi:hypothetical protein